MRSAAAACTLHLTTDWHFKWPIFLLVHMITFKERNLVKTVHDNVHVISYCSTDQKPEIIRRNGYNQLDNNT